MEHLNLNNEVPKIKTNESMINKDTASYEVDPQNRELIDGYKQELELIINSLLSDVEKKEKLDNLKIKLINKINFLEKERDELWGEVDSNEGYPVSEVVLEDDLAKQLTTNINEFSKILNTIDSNK